MVNQKKYKLNLNLKSTAVVVVVREIEIFQAFQCWYDVMHWTINLAVLNLVLRIRIIWMLRFE
eukprot:2835883-Ditylum_brightwellii.AAC.1